MSFLPFQVPKISGARYLTMQRRSLRLTCADGECYTTTLPALCLSALPAGPPGPKLPRHLRELPRSLAPQL